MVRKKLDSRIPSLIQETIQTQTRSFFVIVGDKGRELVCKLQYLRDKLTSTGTVRKSLLWCYHKELGFSTNRKKRMSSIKNKIKSGVLNADENDPFEVFISSHDIRFCYYSETHKILGSTQQLLVLQDFESITPNLLARTMETVEGGGMVVLLLKSMNSLQEVFRMSSLNTSACHAGVEAVGRFNERFILSLKTCASCLVVDDELNVLHAGGYAEGTVSKAIQAAIQREILTLNAVNDPEQPSDDSDADDNHPTSSPRQLVVDPREKKLKAIIKSLEDTQPVGSLVGLCKTIDQAQSVMTFVDAITAKTLRGTVSLTASRGRGKSAACGLSMAAAVAYGYANIFVTAPSPDNLRTVFDFVLKGFDALGYEEHIDYDLVIRREDALDASQKGMVTSNESSTTNSLGNKKGGKPVILRINIFRQHRQTIQYIMPQDANKLGQAELVVVDEAAAIPLPLVRALVNGNHLSFLSTTIHGYEGTGRALTTKLLAELRYNSAAPASRFHHADAHTQQQQQLNASTESKLASPSSKLFTEMSLQTPIRYKTGDCMEDWLTRLLLLDVECLPPVQAAPHPNRCDAYFVNRTSLFSFHPSSERFLKKLTALFVSSHYKNSPNDLQLLSDSPGHRILVLLGPITSEADCDEDGLPEILAAAQLSIEGDLAKPIVLDALARGRATSGDLIPWTMVQHFQDPDFAKLSGVRVVRIATNPSYQRMGYASRLLDLLKDFYHGDLIPLGTDMNNDQPSESSASPAVGGYNEECIETMFEDLPTENVLLAEKLIPRQSLPPLLSELSENLPEKIHYLGVAFGLTDPLLRFWVANQFRPVYLRLKASPLTGEHSCLMLYNNIQESNAAGAAGAKAGEDWLETYVSDFRRRLTELLSYNLNEFSCTLALSLMLSNSPAEASLLSSSDLPQSKAIDDSDQSSENDENADDIEDENADDIEDENADDNKPACGSVLRGEMSNDRERHFSLKKGAFMLAPRDLLRLQSYITALGDYSGVLDLVPQLAREWLCGRIGVRLSPVQAAILVGLGLQRRPMDVLSKDLGLPVSQATALFNRALRRVFERLNAVRTTSIANAFPKPVANLLPQVQPHKSIEADEALDADARAFLDKIEAEKRALLAKRTIRLTDAKPNPKKTKLHRDAKKPVSKKPATKKKYIRR